ncbi:hypothetical protein [Gimesia alba]|uniref:hypothetical protein n=1 Tax=Gimesia alba TaxID=2527973 RepID=UPI0011AA4D30|nr:hypothetical protein [Gimesia alba]
MPNRPCPQSAIRFLLFAGAMCVWSLSAVQTANATCGDYLSHAGQPDDSEMILLHRPDQSPQKSPCSGPDCQNHQPDPSPESPLIVITLMKPACSGSSEMMMPRTPDCGSTGSHPLLLTSPSRQRIDRPPQSASF